MTAERCDKLMPKNIQIPIEFFNDVRDLITTLESVYRHDLDPDTLNLCKSIKAQMQTKIDAQTRRQTFSEYKTSAPGTPEREQKRKEYLKQAAIHKDWISTNETPSL
jgi:hypothetical protein